MKAELNVINVEKYDMKIIESWSKSKLMSELRSEVKQCLLCVANNCSCVQQGLSCSAQSQCSCLRSVGGQRRLRSKSEDFQSYKPYGDVHSSGQSEISRELSSSFDGTQKDTEENSESNFPEVPCGNPFGYDLFDPEAVNLYRKEVLRKFESLKADKSK